MQLPVFKDDDRNFMMLQTKWSSILNPLLALPTSTPSLLTDVVLITGDNVINHRLGRSPQGWIQTDSSAAITLYRSAAFNDLTLTLNSSGAATISLLVF